MKQFPRRRFLHGRIMSKLFAVAVALVATTLSAAAQEWPTRPLTMVVPYAAGGGVDVVGRILAPHMSEYLGQQVVIENIGGAGGITGTVRVAKAAPDGYQFVLGTAGTHAQSQTLYKNPPYHAARDFTTVALIAEAPVALIARKDLPASNLREFISYVKANQQKMQYSSPGVGSAPQLSCVLLHGAIGVDVVHIPHRGTGPAIQDLIAGRIDYMCAATTGVVSQIESNAVKGIALLSRNRSPGLAMLATAHEQGMTDFNGSSWYAFFFPKDTPERIVRKLHDATVKAISAPAVQERLTAIGVDLASPERRSPDYLQRFVETEIAKWAPPIKAAGLAGQ
jgi:tripartite-type tricarboxylate transporter receptor subunit TctC